MAVRNPLSRTDPFGAETYTWWTDGTAIKFTTNVRPTPTTAFVQPVADSPFEIDFGRDGVIYLTYWAADGSRLMQYSRRDGDAGSWATWPPPP